MFNGLIREVGKVLHFEASLLKINSTLKPMKGDSIAVNGVCLSVVALHEQGFSVKVSEETLKCVASENFHGLVHLESAMRLGDLVDGHLLQGHVDAVGVVKEIIHHTVGVDMWIEAPEHILHLIVPKGSIGIDGVSLTVNEVKGTLFRLTIIPITFEESNFHSYKVGRRLNIETDMIVRSLAHLLKHAQPQASSLTWQELDAIALSY